MCTAIMLQQHDTPRQPKLPRHLQELPKAPQGSPRGSKGTLRRPQMIPTSPYEGPQGSPRRHNVTPKSSTKGGGLRPPPLCGFLCIGPERSTCPSSQHSTCLASQQGDVSALNKAHVLRLNTKICPVFTANTKEATKGGRPKAAAPLWRRPKAASFVLAVNTGHLLVLRRKTCALLRANIICLVETQDMCCVGS